MDFTPALLLATISASLLSGISHGLSKVAFALTDTVLRVLLLSIVLLTGDTLLAFLPWHTGWYDKWKLFTYFSYFLVPVYCIMIN